MDHSQCREAISARTDGEPVDEDAIEAHLAGCSECRAWEERLHRLAQTGLRPVESAPVAVVPQERPPGFLVNRSLRVVLAWIGVLLLVWNLPGVLEVSTDPDAVHFARHQSAFAVALGLALLYVAWRPDRAYGMVPFAVTFTIAVALTALVDLVTGSASPTRESLHFLELAGLVALWVLGVRVGPGRRG